MVEIKVLVEGYAREENGREHASSSVTLIKDSKLNILVDTGSNRKLLMEKLSEEGLTCEDIDYIIITHTHLDHCLLIGMFKNAKVLDSESIYESSGGIYEHNNRVPGTNIKIIATPGHTQAHCSVLVNTAEYGKVAVVADVFWWEDEAQEEINKKSLLKLKDPYADDKEELNKSRRKVLEIADYIVPGHGKMFKVNK